MTGEYSLDQGRTDIQQAWVARARLDADKVCQEDEELAHAHCELHRLRTELRDQELREKKQMCEMEEERLRRSLGHLEESNSEVRFVGANCTSLATYNITILSNCSVPVITVINIFNTKYCVCVCVFRFLFLQ